MADGPQNSYEAFAEAVETVVEQRENGRCILVHCSAGSSRSPSVAAAAITHLTENNLNEAFNQIIEERPDGVSNPLNLGFSTNRFIRFVVRRQVCFRTWNPAAAR